MNRIDRGSGHVVNLGYSPLVLFLLPLFLFFISTNVNACGQAGDGEAAVVPDSEVIWVDASGKRSDPDASRKQMVLIETTRLANAYSRLGTAQDLKAALTYYQQAAEQGYAPAQNNLANYYLDGIVVEKDASKALGWYRKAAERGNPEAQHSLGMMLLKGQSTAKNVSEGVNWLEKAAAQGHLSAVKDLGAILWQGKFGIKVDRVRAYQWLLFGVMQGDDDSELLKAEADLDITVDERLQAQQRFENRFIAKPKRTFSGLYLTARGAYRTWKRNQGLAVMIDVRTQAEFKYIGHPEMAVNVPLEIITTEGEAGDRNLKQVSNTDFLKQIKQQAGKDQLVILICRSGHRSARAADMLSRAGYKTVYTVVEGFEGDKLRSANNPENGHRVVNGWRNAGLPWSY